MTMLKRLLCALGWRRFCPATTPHPDRSHEEMERVRERQREIAARVEALGIRVEVPTRRQGDERGSVSR